MAVRNLWLLGGGLAACLVLSGDGYPQPPQPIPQPPLPARGVAPELAPPTLAPVVPAPVPGTTIDQLLDRLTEIRRQKAELERQEKHTIKQLRDMHKALTERLEKLDIAPERPKAPPLPKGEVKVEAPRLPADVLPESSR